MPSPTPNFFIAGAPKSGTSAMRRYLREHPRVFMTALKEPHFFSTDIDDPVVRGEPHDYDWYLSLFEGAEDAEVIGEASVFYLFSAVAAERIRERYEDARILVMLRNPVDLAYSLHNQLLFTGQETEEDFERAWRLQGRREGVSPLLEYREVAALGSQLERLLGVFDRSRVLAVVYDDFSRDAAGEYGRVLDFLGLDHDGRTEFPVVNPSHRHRSDLLRRFVEWLPSPTLLKRLLRVERIGLADWLYWKNVTPHRRPPLQPEFRAELCEQFAGEVALLSSLLDRDLTHWTSGLETTPPPGGPDQDEPMVLW